MKPISSLIVLTTASAAVGCAGDGYYAVSLRRRPPCRRGGMG